MIGAFALFGLGSAPRVFAAVLTYRLIAFWLPLPPGIVAFFQLRKTVQRWEQRAPGARRRRRDRRVSCPGAAITSESKV